EAIRGRGRRYGLQTDASQRFERGVDFEICRRAIERATALLLEIAGGEPGPVEVTEVSSRMPALPTVTLRRSQLARLLGTTIEPARVTEALRALEMKVHETNDGWSVVPPSHRFDISIEADLIEEVARIVGLDAIPETDPLSPQRFHEVPEEQAVERNVLDVLASRGYQEAITFAFVDPQLQERLFPDRKGHALSNPIAADLSVMRLSLWPGLLRVA